MNWWLRKIEEEREVLGKCAWCGKHIWTGPCDILVMVMLSEKLSEEVERRHSSAKEALAVQLILMDKTLVGLRDKKERGGIFGKENMFVTLRAGNKSCAKAMMKAIKRELDVIFCKAYIFGKIRRDLNRGNGHIID